MVLRRAKILATLGPASSDETIIQALQAAGADAFRVNASHMSPAEVAAQVRLIRLAAPSAAVLVDIQGPKLRLGVLTEARSISPGEVVEFSHLDSVASGVVPLGFDPFEVGLERGHRVIFADGRVEALVVEAVHPLISIQFPSGGVLESRKGVNLPDTLVRLPVIGEADLRTIEAGLEAGCDWFALSFVQTAADMLELRELVGNKARLMAKIERPQAVVNLESIARVSDAVLVARGDLGVEFPFEQVPMVQREVWECCTAMGVPVVCATEMLESMIVSSRPTRAEATDVAQAVFDTFDAVMLSAETAVGHDPVGAVSAMSRIRAQVELSERFTQRLGRQSAYQARDPRTSAVAAAAEQLARSVEAVAIIALTSSGVTAGTLSACRPSVPVIAVTASRSVARQLNMLWGVTALMSEKSSTVELAATTACRAAAEAGLIQSGDLVVVCGSRIGPLADADAIWVQHA